MKPLVLLAILFCAQAAHARIIFKAAIPKPAT